MFNVKYLCDLPIPKVHTTISKFSAFQNIKWFIYLSIINLINCRDTILITFWATISWDLIFLPFENKKHGYYEKHWQLLNIWEFFTKMFSDVIGMIKIGKRCIFYQKRRRVKIFSNVLDDIWYASILHKLFLGRQRMYISSGMFSQRHYHTH